MFVGEPMSEPPEFGDPDISNEDFDQGEAEREERDYTPLDQEQS